MFYEFFQIKKNERNANQNEKINLLSNEKNVTRSLLSAQKMKKKLSIKRKKKIHSSLTELIDAS